jgi:hypothetical protein
MFMFHLSLHATAAKSYFTRVFKSPCLRLSFLQNVKALLFNLVWQYHSSLRFFICKSLNKSREEKETVPAELVSQTSNPCSMSWQSCGKCRHCSTCMFLSLPKHTDKFYAYIYQNNTASGFWLQTICLFLILHNLSYSSVLCGSFLLPLKYRNLGMWKNMLHFTVLPLNDHKELVVANSLSVCLFVHDQYKQQHIRTCTFCQWSFRCAEDWDSVLSVLCFLYTV